jgi:hypothetical protein
MTNGVVVWQLLGRIVMIRSRIVNIEATTVEFISTSRKIRPASLITKIVQNLCGYIYVCQVQY